MLQAVCSIFLRFHEHQFPEGTGVGRWPHSSFSAYESRFVRPAGIGPATISLKDISRQKQDAKAPFIGMLMLISDDGSHEEKVTMTLFPTTF